MTKRRAASNKWSPKKKRASSYQLHIEPLEARRLLAGIQVSVFVDQDGSRDFNETSEVPAPDRLVYLDLNRNGGLDADEPIRVTNADGVAIFDGLTAGDYSVGLLTNPNSQQQTTSVRVAQVATQESETGAVFLLADGDAQHLWTVDAQGTARAMDSQLPVSNLGGPVADWLVNNSTALLLVDGIGESPGQKLVQLDLSTGESASYVLPFSEAETAIQLAQTADQTVLLIESGNSTSVVYLDSLDSGIDLSSHFELGVTAIAGSPASALWASVTAPKGEAVGVVQSVVRLHTHFHSEQLFSTIELDGVAESISFSADGQLIFVALEGGGVHVLRNTNRHLSREAILADARLPISARASDGRLLSASSAQNRRELIVWDPSTWARVGTSQVDSADELSGIVSNAYGDVAWVASESGVYSVDLAIPDLANLRVENGGPTGLADFGVRVTGENNAPNVDQFGTRTLEEDGADVVSLDGAAGIFDVDGDHLWFTLVSPPAHGQLVGNQDSGWTYRPDPNFHGSDTAVLQVHDGFESVALEVQWQVAPVNDPPLELYVQLPPLHESAAHGSTVGFVSVADIDVGASYRFSASDPRFSIESGQIFFTSGELDFDSEPEVRFEILATDLENPEFQISREATLQLTDVNEPPTTIEVDSNSLPENEAGAVVGAISIDDPDAGAEYEFTTSDDRFEVRDGILRLVDGYTLDYEAENQISLMITAREIGGGEEAGELSQQFEFSVDNRNDPPTGMQLSGLSFEGDREGAVVGQVVVDDVDGDDYEYEVSDDRFEVSDGVLRLRDGVQVEYVADTTVPLTIVGRSSSGDVVTQAFPILLSPPLPPNQNHSLPPDVNQDGEVTPLDVLILVNQINQNGTGPLPTNGGGNGGTGEPDPILPDVNGDGSLTAIDVLMIVNQINNGISSGEGESHSEFESGAVDGTIDEEARKRRQNSDIDAELESLLEELSRYRLNHG